MSQGASDRVPRTLSREIFNLSNYQPNRTNGCVSLNGAIGPRNGLLIIPGRGTELLRDILLRAISCSLWGVGVESATIFVTVTWWPAHVAETTGHFITQQALLLPQTRGRVHTRITFYEP